VIVVVCGAGATELLPVEAVLETRKMELSSTPTRQSLLCQLRILNAQDIDNDITTDLLQRVESPTFIQHTHAFHTEPQYITIERSELTDNIHNPSSNQMELLSERERETTSVPLTRCLALRPFALTLLNDIYTKYHTPLTLLTIQLITGRTHQIRYVPLSVLLFYMYNMFNMCACVFSA
jgi:hypothetical protein